MSPFFRLGDNNQLAIRLDNPLNSSRWYSGGGIYRNVWLTKVNPVHVAQWGTFISSNQVSNVSARINLSVNVENKLNSSEDIKVVTDIYLFNGK